jgi:Inositol hexakisphosphate
LHTETSDGTVVPVWEDVKPEDVMVLRDVMARRSSSVRVALQYNRIPITAEKSPDYSDLHDLIEVTMRTALSSPIIVNCQLGRGRSTLASVSWTACGSLEYLNSCNLDPPLVDQTMAADERGDDPNDPPCSPKVDVPCWRWSRHQNWFSPTLLCGYQQSDLPHCPLKRF